MPPSRIRLAFVASLTFAFYILIVLRMMQLQVLPNPALEDLAQKQFVKTKKIAAARSAIYDRHQEELAVSVPASSVYARPRMIRHKNRAARTLSQILGGSVQSWMQKLNVDKPFVWIQRQVSESLAREIANHRINGLFIEAENRRVYPNGTLAAQLIGFTDIDGKGISGLEKSLDDELLGPVRKYKVARDGKGNPSYIDKRYTERAAEETTGVYLTIDRRIQQVVEEELDKSAAETKADSIMAIAIEPFSGEILAMGQRPGFDPNNAKGTPLKLFLNRNVSSLYEPGSTMKVIVAAHAIETGKLTPDSMIDCGGGKLKIGKKTISEAEADHALGIAPLKKVIETSSNVGAARMAQMLGVAEVKRALERFGYAAKTGVPLPGELASQLKAEKNWDPLLLATVGFGQGVSATPLQITASFAPFANGGYLVKPRLILSENLPDEKNRVRVVSANTAKMVRQMLVGVTEGKHGTGVGAKIPFLTVAGKTGTGQKYDASSGGYESRQYFSSFVGFTPAEESALLVGVFIDNPKGHYYASQTAVPLFKRIMERSLQILDRIPKQNISQLQATLRLPEDAVRRQPVQFEKTKTGWVIPDLKGLTVREALTLLENKFKRVKIVGHGFLDTQRPIAGSHVNTLEEISLQFSPSQS